ncbi:hypothetical protein RA086_02300 [Lactiplantibacillus sp. WILCCON 0030]|uniref:Uncharacterized protein n=1 Tax=Lactiplantibacillus brownii TaxID=3069269 RepID=A0ABU1A696_9LACO|nr:hypothetical protein [Lactiplantibacillus brownii]MDQ7936476.1 hypothetical protein [Lactiplantibacillus brownii]
MKKSDRQAIVSKKLGKNELLYTNKLGVKRIMGQDELLNLVMNLGTVSNEVLANLTANNGVHVFQSLFKNEAIKKRRVYGIAGHRVQNAIFPQQVDLSVLEHWTILSKAIWFLREKGVKLGRVIRVDNDLQAVATFDNQHLVHLQFKLINDDNMTDKPVINDGNAMVAVFESYELMAEVLNKHADKYLNAIINGCIVMCLRRRQDFDTIEGYILITTKVDGKYQLKLQPIVTIDDLVRTNFKLMTEPTGNELEQLEWEYDEALTRTNQSNHLAKPASNGMSNDETK